MKEFYNLEKVLLLISSKYYFIGQIFRQIFAWNKPSMLGMRWIVKIPERFKEMEI